MSMGEQHYRYPEGRILVFARAPVAGQVKTRLAASIGHERAAALYRRWLGDTVRMLASAGLAPLELCITPAAGHPCLDALAADCQVDIRPQGDGDLGQRMQQALQRTLDDNEFAVLIGSDCPAMDAAYMGRACARLRAGVPVVLGPAADGGYVLLGARHCEPRLFHDIPWSSDRVLERTRARLNELGYRYEELDTLADIDTGEDLQQWLQHQTQGTTRGEHDEHPRR